MKNTAKIEQTSERIRESKGRLIETEDLGAAILQESHNKNSMVWYSGTDKAKFRVRFKLTVTQSTDPP